MEVYQTEEQQVEAIKGYWKENGSAIIAGLVIGFSAFIGFNVYKDNQFEQELAVSESFQSVIEQADADGAVYKTAGDKFIAENGESSYASLTALALAKNAATHKDWTEAEKYLTSAINTAKDEGVKAIATVRLARVQLQLAQADKALATINAQLPASFKASVEEIKGDAYLQQDKKDLARNAYQAASDIEGQAANQVLKMKLNDLTQAVDLSSPLTTPVNLPVNK